MAVTIATLKAVVTADVQNININLTIVQNNLKKTEQAASSLQKRLDDMASRLNTIGSALTLGITAPILALGKASVDAAVKFDSLRRGLTAVAGSSKAAEEQLKRLKEVAKLPGLGFAEAIQGSIRLQAAGFSAASAEKSLRAFGNALATVGRGAVELNGVSLALSQIMSKGKVMAEEINQIAERTPQIRQIMLKAFGTADTEILQKAKITSKEFVEIITNELLKLPKVTGGMQNAFENAKDSIEQSLERIGKAVVPLVALFLEKFVPALERVTTAFTELPKETQELSIKFLAFAAAAGPIALLTGQIIELGKAIGIARLAALGPVAGIAALIGVGAVGALSLWNADSDRKAKEAGTTAAQTFEKRLAEIDKALPQMRNELAYKFRLGDKGIKEEAAAIKAMEQERVMVANSYLMAMTKNEEAYQGNLKKLRAASAKQQADADALAAAARKKIQDAEDEIARKKAEAAAKRAAAEAERIRKVNADLEEDLKRLTVDRFAFERFQANQAYMEVIRQNGNRVKAAEVLAAKLRSIEKQQSDEFMAEINKRGIAMMEYTQKQAELQERINKAVRDMDFSRPEGTSTGAAGAAGGSGIPTTADVDAARRRRQNRKGFDIRLPDRMVDSIAGGINPAIAPLPADVIPSRRIDGPGSEVAKRDAELRKKQMEEFAKDMTQMARRTSRNFLKALFGDGRDRANVLKTFVGDLTDTLLDQLSKVSFEKALTPALKGLAENLGDGLSKAVTGVLKVAESSIGRMLGAVYQLLSALNRPKKIGVLSVLGGIAGGITGGIGGAIAGYNIGNALDNGDIGGAIIGGVTAGANGTFGSAGGGSGGGGNGLAPRNFNGNDYSGRSRGVNFNLNVSNLNVNEKADIDRLARENVRRMNLALAAGPV